MVASWTRVLLLGGTRGEARRTLVVAYGIFWTLALTSAVGGLGYTRDLCAGDGGFWITLNPVLYLPFAAANRESCFTFYLQGSLLEVFVRYPGLVALTLAWWGLVSLPVGRGVSKAISLFGKPDRPEHDNLRGTVK